LLGWFIERAIHEIRVRLGIRRLGENLKRLRAGRNRGVQMLFIGGGISRRSSGWIGSITVDW